MWLWCLMTDPKNSPLLLPPPRACFRPSDSTLGVGDYRYTVTEARRLAADILELLPPAPSLASPGAAEEPLVTLAKAIDRKAYAATPSVRVLARDYLRLAAARPGLPDRQMLQTVAEEFERSEAETRDTLAQIEKRQGTQPFGDESHLIAHYQKNVEHYRVRAQAVRQALDAGSPDRLRQVVAWMRNERARFCYGPDGAEVVYASTVDNWADELDAALSLVRPAESPSATNEKS